MIEKLEKKWGKLIACENGYFNCRLPFISDDAKLNILFKPINLSEYESVFLTVFHVEIPKWLIEFYIHYNGCRLFSDSLSIFGIQLFQTKDILPFDIRVENNHIIGKLSKKLKVHDFPYVFFGSLGGEFLFAFQPLSTIIYVFKSGEVEPIAHFASFDLFWSHYFEGLIDEYDEMGKKIHVNKLYKDFPSISNITTDNF